MKKTNLTLHHTAIYANDDVKEQFLTVDEVHRKRWNGKTKSRMGYYGGYHYLIERNGFVAQYRNDDETGAHNNKGLKRIGAWMYSENYYSIGISFAGNMSKQELTAKQIESAVKKIKELQTKHNIPNENIRPHRATSSTQCPGNNIPDKAWEYLQEQYEKLDKDEPIIKWHKRNQIIEKWNNPPTEEELKQGWIAYKLAKAIASGKLKDFNI